MANVVDVRLTLSAQEFMISMARAGKVLEMSDSKARIFNSTLGKVNQALGQQMKLNGAAVKSHERYSQSMLNGIGSFYLFHGAQRMANKFMREGVNAAMELERQMYLLRLSTGASADQLDAYRQIFQKTALTLGPLNTTDIFAGANILSTVPGLGGNETGRKALADQMPYFSQWVSGIMSMSGDKMSAEELYTFLGKMMSSSGGFKDPAWTKTYLNTLFAGISLNKKDDPHAVLYGMTQSLSTLKLLDLPPDQIAALGVLRAMQPTTGHVGGGRELAQLAIKLAQAISDPTKKQAKGLEALGINLASMTTGGKFDLKKFFGELHNMEAATKSFKDKAKFTTDLKNLLGVEIASRYAAVTAMSVGQLQHILDQAKTAMNPKQINAYMQQTAAEQHRLMTENLKVFQTNLFMETNGFVKSALVTVNNVLNYLNKITDPTSGSPTARGASAVAVWAMPAGLSMFTSGAFASGLPGWIGAIGLALATVGAFLMSIATIAVGVVAVIAAYRWSPWFRKQAQFFAGYIMYFIVSALEFSAYWFKTGAVKLAGLIVNMLATALESVGGFIANYAGQDLQNPNNNFIQNWLAQKEQGAGNAILGLGQNIRKNYVEPLQNYNAPVPDFMQYENKPGHKVGSFAYRKALRDAWKRPKGVKNPAEQFHNDPNDTPPGSNPGTAGSTKLKVGPVEVTVSGKYKGHERKRFVPKHTPGGDLGW